MKIWSKDEIVARFDADRAVRMIEQGFIAYSRKAVLVPPIQNFYFAAANGDCCVKSAYVEGAETFAVKVSAGFYNNPAAGLPTNSGLVMIFSAKTGEPVGLLQDGGWLTSVRTAIAGQLAARVLAPREVRGIGIIGTGDQARFQLEYLKPVTTCRDVHAWGPNAGRGERFVADMSAQGFHVTLHDSPESVARHANLIVTTTPSREALLKSEWIAAGTHITAVGADGPGKQELDARIVASAHAIVVDSIAQCSKYGEISHALSAGLIQESALLELGDVLARGGRARDDRDTTQITVADLTGVAVQDAQIADSVVSHGN
ncbi:multidrug DMT transporter permease [Burkholderia aenigmatica]|uniref:Multidrug DMT transporter permease n=1 Tax=Burkholderia aenigmatica TaxID=2015348 RepID=A0A6P2K129_9BURK|nr:MULTISPECIES: ornithine cyclodeaminase family protein [Burkholderia]MDN7516246.1 ornithine cyclodeaminase family protein [Burkholderia sp. AU45251]VWB50671.1 multidrug DMT transporter permease [Burkholderia aenigmatica]HDR9483986.1 ornithine cyclodeaminase family protein [Burkholderia aenigmatica]HDR9514951.1 ornithine cyclodeaminase family protein [Burkholderia aenigmatica]HDR9592036.1 ornithine cyclodeaminase family protein [Burkholderia aenigmatica]